MQTKITRTEESVLKYHKAGKSIREIADILCISHHSVKALLNSAQRKLTQNQ